MSALRVHTGPLAAHHRSRVREILESTDVFRPSEIDVALELFDEAISERATNGRTDERTNGRIDDERQSGQSSVRSGQSSAYAIRNTQYATPPLPSPSSSYVFLGAFTPDDELVGFACYGATPGTDRTFDLYWIAVDRSAQGSGSGTILLSEVERRLEDTHGRILVVETSSRSEYAPTRAFYRARGYAEAARMRDFYAPSDDRIIFTKRFHHPR